MLSMVAVATAMLCKEQGITITGICAVYELFVAQKVIAATFIVYSTLSHTYAEKLILKIATERGIFSGVSYALLFCFQFTEDAAFQ